MRLAPHLLQTVALALGGFGIHGRLSEAGVEHLPLALHRGLGHMLGTTQMDRDITGFGGQIEGFEIEAWLKTGSGPDQGAVASRNHAQLTRCSIGPCHRDAHCKIGALVGMTTQAAVLMPRDIRDSLYDTNGLDQSPHPSAGLSGALAMVKSGDRSDALEASFIDERGAGG